MPLYVYQHPETEEHVEIFQGMNDKHEYIDDEGTSWKRVFLAPNMTLDTDIDPFSQADFVRTTGNKKGTMGEMMDLSKDLSRQRAEKNGGVDPIKEKGYKAYEKKTGKPHPKSKPHAPSYEGKNFKVDY